MVDKTSQNQSKRLSKGQRTYIRRLKQEARKTGTPYRRPVREQTMAGPVVGFALAIFFGSSG